MHVCFLTFPAHVDGRVGRWLTHCRLTVQHRRIREGVLAGVHRHPLDKRVFANARRATKEGGCVCVRVLCFVVDFWQKSLILGAIIALPFQSLVRLCESNQSTRDTFFCLWPFGNKMLREGVGRGMGWLKL